MAPGQIYETSGLVVRSWPGGGRDVVASRAIPAGEVIVIWSGIPMSTAQVEALPEREKDFILQTDDDVFLVTPLDELCTADFVNHSCRPNCGLRDAVTLVAMRNIDVGESITFDYAMSDANSIVEFECRCGADECRGRVTGSDWMLQDLQARYAGWFAPHVQRRIESLSRQGS